MANVEVYTRETCLYCHRARVPLSNKGVSFWELSIDSSVAKRKEVTEHSGRTTVLQTFIDAQHVGGYDDLYVLDACGGLDPLLKQRVNAGITLRSILRTTLKGFLHMSGQNGTKMTFRIQRTYTRDIPFEVLNTPHIFQKDRQPEVKLGPDTAFTQSADGAYEAVLRVTVTAPLDEEVAFLYEVRQDGIFSIAGIEGTQTAHCLDAHCPSILSPHVRECIISMVSHGTFPQLSLAPVNFGVLFMNYLQ